MGVGEGRYVMVMVMEHDSELLWTLFCSIYIYIKLVVFLKSLYLSNTNLLFSFSRY